MSSPPARSRRFGRRLRLGAAVAAVGALLAASLTVPPAAQAAGLPSLQTIAVRQVRDGSLVRISDTTAVRSSDNQVASWTDELDPAQAAAKLPLRIQTEYWLKADDGADQTGTDLTEILGRKGRVTIQLSVENTTVTPQPVEYSAVGTLYRQYAPVGVPLTVVASAALTAQTGLSVVTTDSSGATATNGLIADTVGGGPSVQWAALLAPPLLPPVARFRLVEQTERFALPTFDVTVQTGLVTDPSLSNLLVTSLSSSGPVAQLEESTVRLILGVNEQITAAQDFAEKVHQAVAGDAQALGAKAYQELEASSSTMLAQIDATTTTLTSLQQQTSGSIGSANSQLSAGLNQVLAQLSAALGSTTGPLPLADTVFSGCTMTLPTLAPDTPRTLAATVRLVGQQILAVATAFDQDDPNNPAAGTCRRQMIEQLRQAIGQPGDTCPDDPATPQVEPVTVQCAITTAQQRIWDQITTLQALDSQIAGLWTNAGVPALQDQVNQLRQDWDNVQTGLLDVQTALNTSTTDMQTSVTTLTTQLGTVRQALAAISSPTNPHDLLDGLTAAIGQAGTARAAYDDVMATIAAAAQPAPGPAPATPPATPITPVTGVIGVGATPVNGVLPVVAGGIVAQLRTLVTGQPATCAGTGFDTAQFADVAAIEQALTALAQRQGCPAQPLAGALRTLIQAYDQAAQTGGTAQQAASQSYASYIQARDALATIAGLATPATNPALQAASQAFSAAVTSLTTTTSDLRTQADLVGVTLDQALVTLAQISQLTQQGSLDQARQLVTQLVTVTLPALRAPTNPIQPGDTPCPTDWTAPPTGLATGSIDAIVQLTDRLTCLDGTVVTTLNSWFGTAQADLASARDQLGSEGAVAAQQALDQVEQEISRVSKTLSDTLRGGITDTITEDLAAIDLNREQTQTAVNTMLADLTVASQNSVTQLTEQINQANANAVASRDLLQGDFTRLLANLGTSDPTSRVGLLGKLRSTADEVGSVSDTLTTVEQTTTGHLNVRQADLLALALHDAQYTAAEQLRARYHPFANAHTDEVTVTVYTYHLGNN